ncbi:MAG: hypothetical protein LBO06_08055 [Bacteroidales bacterium]|nr:hypothetical protein [Bacteroidales bacterium]
MAQPPNDKQTQAILKFNHLIANDTDFDQVILPIRDGITLARKK